MSDIPIALVKSQTNDELVLQTIQNMQNALIAQNVQNPQSVQNAQPALSIQSVPPAQNLQSAQNIQILQNLQNAQNIQQLQSAQNNQNLQNAQNIQHMQNAQNIQRMQNAQNIQRLQNAQNAQNLQNLSNVPNIQQLQNVPNLQLFQNAPKAQNAGKNVYQFKITLKRIKPTIWRRIQVPEDYTFSDLSNAILNAMGWAGGHLHDFKMKNPESGGQETIGEDPSIDNSCCSLNEKEAKIKDFFINSKSKAVYTYDFGDCWEHDVQLMRIVPANPGTQYPICVAGKRACPPEDCGGINGYQELLQKRAKPKEERTAEENEELVWYNMGDDFDPEEFDPKSVDFSVFDFFSMLGER